MGIFPPPDVGNKRPVPKPRSTASMGRAFGQAVAKELNEGSSPRSSTSSGSVGSSPILGLEGRTTPTSVLTPTPAPRPRPKPAPRVRKPESIGETVTSKRDVSPGSPSHDTPREAVLGPMSPPFKPAPCPLGASVHSSPPDYKAPAPPEGETHPTSPTLPSPVPAPRAPSPTPHANTSTKRPTPAARTTPPVTPRATTPKTAPTFEILNTVPDNVPNELPENNPNKVPETVTMDTQIPVEPFIPKYKSIDKETNNNTADETSEAPPKTTPPHVFIHEPLIPTVVTSEAEGGKNLEDRDEIPKLKGYSDPKNPEDLDLFIKSLIPVPVEECVSVSQENPDPELETDEDLYKVPIPVVPIDTKPAPAAIPKRPQNLPKPVEPDTLTGWNKSKGQSPVRNRRSPVKEEPPTSENVTDDGKVASKVPSVHTEPEIDRNLHDSVYGEVWFASSGPPVMPQDSREQEGDEYSKPLTTFGQGQGQGQPHPRPPMLKQRTIKEVKHDSTTSWGSQDSSLSFHYQVNFNTVSILFSLFLYYSSFHCQVRILVIRK